MCFKNYRKIIMNIILGTYQVNALLNVCRIIILATLSIV